MPPVASNLPFATRAHRAPDRLQGEWGTCGKLFLIALVAYVLLGRQELHGIDGHGFALQLRAGEVHRFHYLYLPLCRPVWHLFSACGLDPLSALRFCSSLGAALSLLIFYWVVRTQQGLRRHALPATIYVGGCPAFFYFASVPEVHAVFLPFAAASVAAFVTLRARCMIRGVVVGILTGLASSVHTSGHLLPATFPIWSCLGTSVGRRATPTFLATCALVQITTWASLAVLLAPDSYSALSPFHFAAHRGSLFARANPAGFALSTAWYEWVRPFFPLSILAVLALRHIRAVFRLHVAVALYLATALLLLGGAREFGAYLLPLACPAALVASRLLSARKSLTCSIAVAATTATLLTMGDDPRQRDGLAAAIAQENANEPMFLIYGTRSELDSLAAGAVFLPGLSVADLHRVPPTPLGYHWLSEGFTDLVEEQHRLGRRLVITERAFEQLRATPHMALRRFGLEHLPRHYDLTAIQRGAFSALHVTNR
ncbi:MAG: hypothetical protein AAF628_27100 [Planctomycetota bacterium]